MNNWNNLEINLLRKNYKKSWKVLVRLFSSRTIASLRLKINRLGLRRGRNHKGKNNPMYGKQHTKVTKILISKANKGSKGFLGCKHTLITKEKMRSIRKGKTYEEIFGLKKAKELRKKRVLLMKGKKRPDMIILWQNEEYRNKCLKAWHKSNLLSPNKPEKCLIKLLDKNLPKTYKFVGDGKLIINGFCPDFVNKDNNKIIEMYGDYWHNKLKLKKRDKRRIITYKKHGYKTLVIWEHELKDLNKVKNKIQEFSNA